MKVSPLHPPNVSCVSNKQIMGLMGLAGGRLRYLGLNTPHFHNLTDMLREELASGGQAAVVSASRRRGNGPGKHELSNLAEPGSNLAVFQVTGELPLAMDFVFTGNTASESAQASRTTCQH